MHPRSLALRIVLRRSSDCYAASNFRQLDGAAAFVVWPSLVATFATRHWSRLCDVRLPYAVSVAITDRTRKILWVKAGGRCSICRVQVVTDGTDTDDPSVFGEEAHIVSPKLNGPRARPIENPDSHANLILLCRKHHKQVDDQVLHFTEERLKEIKRKHEAWAANRDQPGPVRLVPDPRRPTAKVLKAITTGTSLWNLVDGSLSLNTSVPEGLRDEEEDLIAAFLEDVSDWNTVAGGIGESFKAKRDAARGLGERIKSLAEAGFLVGARERFLLLTGGVDEAPWPWRATDIEVHRASEVELADAAGNPLKSAPESETSS